MRNTVLLDGEGDPVPAAAVRSSARGKALRKPARACEQIHDRHHSSHGSHSNGETAPKPPALPIVPSSAGASAQPERADQSGPAHRRKISSRCVASRTARVACCLQFSSEDRAETTMADIVDRATRSRMMAGIGSRNTRPELALRRAIHARGLRYRLHDRRLPGTPDLVFRRFGAVCLVHGCFWHRHADCPYATTPSTRREFWRAKFDGTRNGTGATDTTCSRPAGESRPSGNAPCASRLRRRLRSNWKAGCAVAPPSSTRVRSCRTREPKPAHHDHDGPKRTRRTVFLRPPKRTRNSHPAGRSLGRNPSPDCLRQEDHTAGDDTPLLDGKDSDASRPPVSGSRTAHASSMPAASSTVTLSALSQSRRFERK